MPAGQSVETKVPKTKVDYFYAKLCVHVATDVWTYVFVKLHSVDPSGRAARLLFPPPLLKDFRTPGRA